MLGAPPVHGSPVHWDFGTNHTNHWYEAFIAPGPIFWEDAEAAAVSRGGYLATILSAEENDFVFGLIDSPAYWSPSNQGNLANLGPYLGGYQVPCSPEPACGWIWLNGDGPLVYANWHSSEPSNGFAGESRVHYFEYNGRSSAWNDIASQSEWPAGNPLPASYVVEYNADPAAVPEPASLVLLSAGLLLLARLRALGRRATPK